MWICCFTQFFMTDCVIFLDGVIKRLPGEKTLCSISLDLRCLSEVLMRSELSEQRGCCQGLTWR